MVLPLTIPGVIPGISILVIASNVASELEKGFDLELEFLRPGIVLVVRSLTIYDRMAKAGSAPVLNAVSLFTDTGLSNACGNLNCYPKRSARVIAYGTITLDCRKTQL